MNVYNTSHIEDLLRGNSYAGRGIVIGMTEDGKKACAAYFIMGRSENSRNRVFTESDGRLYTRPYDESKVEDPSLIIYTAVRQSGEHLVVTNGDQTDTVCDSLDAGGSFAQALCTRTFEPDAPNYTPRISGMITFSDGDFSYDMSILKSTDGKGQRCSRYFYSYPSCPGLGHFIHTYMGDGSPLPTFTGEPERVFIPDDIDSFADGIWNSLDKDNKISLYVRYTDLSSGETQTRIINKNTDGGEK